MDFRHLRYFVAVAEEGTFTRAARRAHVAQPALSRQIQDLEEEIGAQLLVRSSRGVSLTAAGATLLEHARTLLAREEHARGLIRRLGGGPRVVRVGTPTVEPAYGAVVEALAAFRARYPEFAAEPAAVPDNDQPRAVAEGILDIGWHFAAPEETGVEGTAWETLSLDHVLLPEAHPAAGSPTVSLPALSELPFHVVWRSPWDHRTDFLVGRLRSAGWTGPVLGTDVISRAAMLISAGQGWCLLPGAHRMVLPAGVALRPLAEGARDHLDLHLLWRSGLRDPGVREMVTLLMRTRGAAGGGHAGAAREAPRPQPGGAR